MDESVICIEEQYEVIDLSETGSDTGENATNNEFEDFFIRKRQTRSQKRKEAVQFVDLSKEPDIDIKKLRSEKSADTKSRRSSNLSLSCPICYERLLNVSVKTTMCGHVFCSTCIESVVRQKKNCPTCRKKITMKSLIPLYL